jgi:nucleoside-diphosphate-sugar epimerase
MRVHVTGASGFLGGFVVPLLIQEGHEVTALARSSEAALRVGRLGAEPVSGDLDIPATVAAAFAAASADALVNLASLGFGHAPLVIASAEKAGIKRAVFMSTTAIFTTLDSRSKAVRLQAEAAIRGSVLDWTVLRPTMIYGTPADRNMARLLRVLRRAPVVPVPGGGRRLQQPVHVEDLAGAVVCAVERDQSIGRIYDVAGPEAITFRQIVEQAVAAVGTHPRLVPVPLAPMIGGLRAYEAAARALARTPRIKAEQLERLAEDKRFDIAAARADLDFEPRPFHIGIADEAALLK